MSHRLLDAAHRRAYACILLLTTLFVLLGAGAAQGGSSITFVGNFETGDYGQWGVLQHDSLAPTSANFQVVTSPVRQGTYAAKFTAKQAYSPFGWNESTEVTHEFSDQTQGTDYYYGVSLMFPTSWTDPVGWAEIEQWYTLDFGQFLGPAPLAIDAGAGQIGLNVNTGLSPIVGGPSFQWAYSHHFTIAPTLSLGQWNDIVLHVHWAADNSGVLEVWWRTGNNAFTKVLSLTGIPTLRYNPNFNGGAADPIGLIKEGIYRSSDCNHDASGNIFGPSQAHTPGTCYYGAAGSQPDTVVYDDGFVRAAAYDDVVNELSGTTSSPPPPPPTTTTTTSTTQPATTQATTTTLTPAVTSNSAAFGKTAVGANWDTIGSGYKDGVKATLNSPGIVTDIKAYQRGMGGSTWTSTLTASIYKADGANGGPGTLITTSKPVTVTATDGPSWRDYVLSNAVSLPAGTYWLILLAGGSSVAQTAADRSTGIEAYNANAYASGPSNPFGTASLANSDYSIYAVYSPVSSGSGGGTTTTTTTKTTTTTPTTTTTTTTTTTQSGPPASSTPPVVSGSALVGSTLNVSNGAWSGSPTSYAYQWQHCDTNGSNCANLSGATGQTYTVASAVAGQTLRAAVTASNSGGSGLAVSNVTSAVTAPTALPTNTAAPSISGPPVPGKDESASAGTWSGNPTSIAYQWLRCDSSGANCANVAGATSASYTTTQQDSGSTLRVVVVATNAGGSTAATAAPSKVIH
jgi:hypothetical protein